MMARCWFLLFKCGDDNGKHNMVMMLESMVMANINVVAKEETKIEKLGKKIK
jgi:hypothetical protein